MTEVDRLWDELRARARAFAADSGPAVAELDLPLRRHVHAIDELLSQALDDMSGVAYGSPMASRELFVTPSQDDIALDFELKGRRTVMEAFGIDRTFSRDELRTSWPQIAEHEVTEFFDRFGFNLEGQRLRRWVYLPE